MPTLNTIKKTPTLRTTPITVRTCCDRTARWAVASRWATILRVMSQQADEDEGQDQDYQ
jgi:hypothetical protein